MKHKSQEKTTHYPSHQKINDRYSKQQRRMDNTNMNTTVDASKVQAIDMTNDKMKTTQDEAKYARHVRNIEELMDNPNLKKYMGQHYLEDYIRMGVVSLDTKEQTFIIWMQKLVDILVMKGEVEKTTHEAAKNSMNHYLSAVISRTKSMYKPKVNSNQPNKTSKTTQINKPFSIRKIKTVNDTEDQGWSTRRNTYFYKHTNRRTHKQRS
jgi:hypothetical protein